MCKISLYNVYFNGSHSQVSYIPRLSTKFESGFFILLMWLNSNPSPQTDSLFRQKD